MEFQEIGIFARFRRQGDDGLVARAQFGDPDTLGIGTVYAEPLKHIGSICAVHSGEDQSLIEYGMWCWI